MANCDQPAAQFSGVVDLAVIDKPYGFILVAQGLMSAFQVNDAEPCGRKADPLPHIDPFIVRTAMLRKIGHLPQR